MAPYFIYFPHHPTLVYISTLSDRNVPILFSLDILSVSGVSCDFRYTLYCRLASALDLIVALTTTDKRTAVNFVQYEAYKTYRNLAMVVNESLLFSHDSHLTC
jgi:hypothetical protein